MKRRRNFIKDENEMVQDVYVSWKSDVLSTICSDMSDKQRTTFLFELIGRLPANNRLFLVRNVDKIANIDYIAELPTELSLHILKYVDALSLFRCIQVSKFWNKLINCEYILWKRLCQTHRITLSPTLPNPTASYYKHQLTAYLSYLHKLRHKTGHVTSSVYSSTGTYAHSSRTLGLTANSTYIYSGGDDRQVRVWDRDAHFPVSSRNSMGISCLDCTEFVVAAGQFDGCITVYDNVLDHVIVTCSRHMGPVYDVCCSQDSTTIVSGSSDCTVRVWHIDMVNNSYSCFHVFRGHETLINKVLLVLPPAVGSTRIFSMENYYILVWDVEQKSKMGVIKPLTYPNCKQEYFLSGLHCTTTHNMLVCGSSNGVYFWDLQTLEIVRVVTTPASNENIVGVGSALMLITCDDGIAVIDTVTGVHYGSFSVPQFSNSNCAVWVSKKSPWLDGMVEKQSESVFTATTAAADILSFYLKLPQFTDLQLMFE